MSPATGAAAAPAGPAADATLTPERIETLVLDVCEPAPNGLTDKQVVEKLGVSISPQARALAYNRLLKRGRLVLAHREIKGKKAVLYMWQSAKRASRLRDLDSSERMVLSIVERSQETGVSKNDVKYKTNIQLQELKLILDRLVRRNLIKEISSVQGSKRKIYISADVEASTAHTGGPWYNAAQEFDQEFIGILYSYVLAFVGEMEYVTPEQVTSYVAETKISKEDLLVADIRNLMSTMLYDGQIELCAGPAEADASTEHYRRVRVTPAVNHLASLPCGPCPVFNECTPGGVISPTTCVYMDGWLKSVTDW